MIPKHTFAPNLIISGMVSVYNLRVFQTNVPFTFRLAGDVSIKKFKLLKVALKSFWETFYFRFRLLFDN